jgi:hypothetical protein
MFSVSMNQKVGEPDIEKALKKWVVPQYGAFHNKLDQVIEDMSAEDQRANSYNVISGGAKPCEKSKSSSNQKTDNQDSKDSKINGAGESLPPPRPQED